MLVFINIRQMEGMFYEKQKSFSIDCYWLYRAWARLFIRVYYVNAIGISGYIVLYHCRCYFLFLVFRFCGNHRAAAAKSEYYARYGFCSKSSTLCCPKRRKPSSTAGSAKET